MSDCLSTILSRHRASTLLATYFRWLQQLAAGLFEASGMRFQRSLSGIWPLASHMPAMLWLLLRTGQGYTCSCIRHLSSPRTCNITFHAPDQLDAWGFLGGWKETQVCKLDSGTLLGNPCPASHLLKSFSSDDWATPWVLDKLGCTFTPHGKACLQLLCTDNPKAFRMCQLCSQAMSLCSSVRL